MIKQVESESIYPVKGSLVVSAKFFNGKLYATLSDKEFRELLSLIRLLDESEIDESWASTVCRRSMLEKCQQHGLVSYSPFEVPEKRTPTIGRIAEYPESLTEALAGVGLQAQRAWLAAYPSETLFAEIGRAWAWLCANPNRRKKDVARFYNNWLGNMKKFTPESATFTKVSIDL